MKTDMLKIAVIQYFLKNRNNGNNNISGYYLSKVLNIRKATIYSVIKELQTKEIIIKENGNGYKLNDNFNTFEIDELFLDTLYKLYEKFNSFTKLGVYTFIDMLKAFLKDIEVNINK